MDKRHKRSLFLAIALSAALFFLITFSFTRFFLQVMAYYQISLTTPLPKDVKPYEAIVVLTGDQKRIPMAIQLLRTRRSPWLIISGTGKKTTLTALINQQLGDATNIQEVWGKILLDQSTSTIENARATAQFVQNKKLKRLILVTHDYHMLRALQIFEAVLPDVEIIPYPVASPFGDAMWESYSHVWIEYCKLLMFQLVSKHSLSPAINSSM